MQDVRSENQGLLLCQIEGVQYGFWLSEVREIIQYASLESVSDVPPHVLGIRNIRGEQVPVIDLLRFTDSDRSMRIGDESCIVIALAGNGTSVEPVGILVDAINGTHETSTAQWHNSATIAGQRQIPHIGAVANIKGDLVFVLDLNRLLVAGAANISGNSGSDVSRHARGTKENVVKASTKTVLEVGVGNQEFAVMLDEVKRIDQVQTLSQESSDMPAHVMGAMESAGELMAAVHVGQLLGTCSGDAGGRVALVSELGGQPCGYICDRIGSLHEVAENLISSSPAEGMITSGCSGTGLVQLDERTLELLSLSTLIQPESQNQIQRWLEERSNELRASKETETDLTEQVDASLSQFAGTYLHIRIGGDSFAIGSNEIQEIVACDSLNRMPGTPSFFAGILTVRKTAYPIMDLSDLLTLPHSGSSRDCAVILRNRTNPVGIRVSQVERILNVEASSLSEWAPSHRSDGGKMFFSATAQVGGETIHILNLEAMFSWVESETRQHDPLGRAANEVVSVETDSKWEGSLEQ